MERRHVRRYQPRDFPDRHSSAIGLDWTAAADYLRRLELRWFADQDELQRLRRAVGHNDAERTAPTSRR